jgi:hypothetical protein
VLPRHRGPARAEGEVITPAHYRRLWFSTCRFLRAALSRMGAASRHLAKLVFSATGLSAVAALLSAFAAVIAVTMQEQSAINAVRPEVIVEWRPGVLADDSRYREYQLVAIENIGEGPAFSVIGQLRTPGHDAPFCAPVLFGDLISALPKGKRKDITWRLRFDWACSPTNDFVFLRLLLYYEDVNNNVHTRALNLSATRGPEAVGTEKVAEGLYLYSRCADIRVPHAWDKLLWIPRNKCE